LIRATADTNVYISALHFGGLPRQFLIAAHHKRFELSISPPIMDETQRILREKFSWAEGTLQRQMLRLSHITRMVYPAQTFDAVPTDADDNRILECAAQARASFIVTGDNDLLRLGSFQTIRMLRVAEFMALLPT